MMALSLNFDGQLEAVKFAYDLGSRDRHKISASMRIPLKSVDDCLVWLRKADFDLDLASKLRSEASMRSKEKSKLENAWLLAAE